MLGISAALVRKRRAIVLPPRLRALRPPSLPLSRGVSGVSRCRGVEEVEEVHEVHEVPPAVPALSGSYFLTYFILFPEVFDSM